MGGASPMVHYYCEVCKVDFVSRMRYDRQVRYCSRKCAGVAKLGKEAWNKGQPAPWAKGNKHAVGVVPWNKGLTGYENNSGPASRLLVGPKNGKWKGGEWRMTVGYIQVLMPEHPRANCHKRVPRYTLVAEREIGRFLKDGEVVHHINEVKDDDRPENLYLFPHKRDHARYHMQILHKKCAPITESNFKEIVEKEKAQSVKTEPFLKP